MDVPTSLIIKAGLLLDESRWQPSSQKGLLVRVDPERPELKQRRHVHVAIKKHTKNKNKQVSWNDDGSRHDRNSFNDDIGKQAAYQNAARSALGLPPTAILEKLETGHKLLIESTVDEVAPVAVYQLKNPSRASRILKTIM